MASFIRPNLLHLHFFSFSARMNFTPDKSTGYKLIKLPAVLNEREPARNKDRITVKTMELNHNIYYNSDKLIEIKNIDFLIFTSEFLSYMEDTWRII